MQWPISTLNCFLGEVWKIGTYVNSFPLQLNSLS